MVSEHDMIDCMQYVTESQPHDFAEVLERIAALTETAIKTIDADGMTVHSMEFIAFLDWLIAGDVQRTVTTVNILFDLLLRSTQLGAVMAEREVNGSNLDGARVVERSHEIVRLVIEMTRNGTWPAT